jgi:hypothetical protein
LEQIVKSLNEFTEKNINLLKKNWTMVEELKPSVNIPGVKRKRFIYGPYVAYGLNVSSSCPSKSHFDDTNIAKEHAEEVGGFSSLPPGF